MHGDGGIRVMLVDDHRCVLWGLEKLIDGEKPRMQIVAKATDCAGAIEVARDAKPDVVVLDLDLAGENAADIIPALVATRATRVLVLTGIRDPKRAEAAILSGACGLVHKEEPAETLLKAIERVHGGELWLDRATTGRVFVELSKPKGSKSAGLEQHHLSSLTFRERSILDQLVADPGADNRHLAEKLRIGEHTLRNHLSRIYEKLGVPNRLELYVYALRRGMGPGSRPAGE